MPRRNDPFPVNCTRLILLSVLLCAPALRAQTAMPASSAPLKHERNVRNLIENLEQQWRTATLNSDAVSMEKLLSDDYVGISWTGQVNTKAMQLDRIRNRTFIVHSMELSDLKVKVVQSVAIVTCRATVDSMNDGKDTSGEFLYTRVYQRQPSGIWKITNFEGTRIPFGHHHKGPPPPPPPPAS